MTPCREKETFVCRVGFGSSALAPDLGEPAALVLEAPQRDPEQAVDHASLLTPVRAIRAPISGSDSCVPASSHQPRDAMARERARSRVVAVHVGDLELAARGRLEAADDLEHVRRVAVEPDDGVARGRRVVAHVDDARLLDHVGDPPVVAVDDDAEALGVGDFLHEDGRAVVALDEAADRVGLGILEDVVAEADDELVVAGEALGHADDLRDPARLDLHLVGEIEIEERVALAALLHPPVAEQVDQLARMALAGDDHHLPHAGELEQLQRVVDHRPAADREQVLVDDARQLAEPRRLAARCDQSLDPHAAADATAGPARGVRSSSQNESSTAGPIPSAKTSVPIPAVPPSAKPTRARRARGPSARRRSDAEPLRGDEHQRVARAGAHRGADVESGADAEEGERDDEERDPHAQRPARRARDRCRARQRRSRTGRSAGRSSASRGRCAPAGPREREDEDRDDEVGGAERDPELLGESLVKHVPRRQAELGLQEADDAAGAEDEAEHEPGEPRGEAAVERVQPAGSERSCEASATTRRNALYALSCGEKIRTAVPRARPRAR